jgi:hypothetical protein
MRQFTEGAEMKDLLFWDLYHNHVAIFAGPISPWCYGITDNSYARKLITATSEGYARIRMSHGANIYTNSRFISFISGGVTGTELAYLSTDGLHWAIYTSAGLLLDSGIVINDFQTYLVEIYFKLDDAPNGRFVIYVDGLKIIDFTGDTKPGAQTTFDCLNFVGTSNTGLYIDDMAFNDTSNADGKNDTSWCGDGVVIKHTPDATTVANWTGQDADQVDNHLNVDEYIHDGDTTYNYSDGATAGTQDHYGLTHVSYAGKTILRIYAEARGRKTAADAGAVKVGTLAAGGSDVMGAAVNLDIGAYKRIMGPEAKVNPVDTNAWEEADLDALEAIIETA